MLSQTRPTCQALILAFLALLAGALAHAEPRWLVAADAREPWRLALDRAKGTREPIMAFVYVEHEPMALAMAERTLGHADVEKALRDFLCVQVNAVDVESNRVFLDTYHVGRQEIEVNVAHVPGEGEPKPQDPNEAFVVGEGRAATYPVTLFINPDGVPEFILYGVVAPENFLGMLGKIKEVMRLREVLRAKADDAKALAGIGGLFVGLERYAAGQEALQKAMALDQDGKLGVGETALLDLAMAAMAESDGTQAVELVNKHLDAYPDSTERCRAHFLLGAALLVSVEPDRVAVEELADQGKAEEAAQARRRLLEGRAQAEKAWTWFEGEIGKAPCENTEWSAYSLGALEELRAEIAYGSLSEEVDGLVAEGKIEGAVERLRIFGTDKDKGHPGTDRGCEALFHVGEILLKAGKRAEALAQWRKLADPNPVVNPCAQTPWRAQAESAVQDQAQP